VEHTVLIGAADDVQEWSLTLAKLW